MIRFRWPLAAAFALALAGCASTWDVETDETAAAEPHHWFFYPASGVYYCDVHGHYLRNVEGRWVEADELRVEPEGRAVELETTSAEPYLEHEEATPDRPVVRPVGYEREPEPDLDRSARHVWAFFPRSAVYYCHVHDHYFHESGGEWVEAFGSIDAELVGPSHVVEYEGEFPYLRIEFDRARHRP